MAKSIKVAQKKRGRPATGKHPHVAARMPQTLIDEIDRWAQRSDVSRSDAIRRLVELGLKAKAK
jgi:Arc/MetJ-type ribon-helix-helix transcriptional regulator